MDACEAHLKTCAGCAAEFRRLQAVRDLLAAPEGLRARIAAAVEAEAGAPARTPLRAPRLGGWLAGG